ncbi:MAG: hypothetical protein ACR65O_05370 [Methylomicrobium sp.]
MRKSIFLSSILFVFALALPAFAEPPTDPYRPRYCELTAEQVDKLSADMYWLNTVDPKLRQMDAPRRLAWVENYALTLAVLEGQQQEYRRLCSGVVNKPRSVDPATVWPPPETIDN